MAGWQRLDTKIVYQNPFLSVHEDNAVTPDGRPTTYAWFEIPPSVQIVAIDGSGKVMLVQQERYTIGRPTWELPAGAASGEDEEDAAKRELAEETGLHADRWERMSSEIYPAVNLSPARVVTFVARDLHHAKQTPTADDVIITSRAFTWAELKKLIKHGEITAASTLTGLMLAGFHLGHLE